MKGGDGESDGKFDPSMLLSLVAGLTKGILYIIWQIVQVFFFNISTLVNI